MDLKDEDQEIVGAAVASIGHASLRLAKIIQVIKKSGTANSNRFRPQEDEGPRYDMEVVVDAMGEGSGGAAVLQTSSPDTPLQRGKTPV